MGTLYWASSPSWGMESCDGEGSVGNMTFTAHADGRVTVDQFDEIITVSSLFDSRFPQWMSIEGDRVRFHVSNGEATYIVTDVDAPYETFTLSRLYFKMRTDGRR